MNMQLGGATSTQLKLHQEAKNRRTKFFGSTPPFCDRQYLQLSEDKRRMEMSLTCLKNDIDRLRSQKHELEAEIDVLKTRREIARENEGKVDAGQRPTLKQIIHHVCNYYDAKKDDIFSTRRLANAVKLRHVITWLAKELTILSFPELGLLLKRDHSTLVHGFQKIERDRKTSQQLNADLAHLKSILGGE